MGKLLLWILVILAVMMVMRIVAARNSAKHAAHQPAPPPARQPGQDSVESMVRCEHCGIHLPRSEATLVNGKTWCGPEHARLGAR